MMHPLPLTGTETWSYYLNSFFAFRCIPYPSRGRKRWDLQTDQQAADGDASPTPHGDGNRLPVFHTFGWPPGCIPYPSRGRKLHNVLCVRALLRCIPYPSRGRKHPLPFLSSLSFWMHPLPLTGTETIQKR